MRVTPNMVHCSNGKRYGSSSCRKVLNKRIVHFSMSGEWGCFVTVPKTPLVLSLLHWRHANVKRTWIFDCFISFPCNCNYQAAVEYVVKALCGIGNQAFCYMQTLSLKSHWVHVLLSWPAVHISQSQRNERAYLSSIRNMLGNVFFTHTKTRDGEAVRLIINIAMLLCSYWSVPHPSRFIFVMAYFRDWYHLFVTRQYLLCSSYIVSIFACCRSLWIPLISAISPSYGLFLIIILFGSSHYWNPRSAVS